MLIVFLALFISVYFCVFCKACLKGAIWKKFIVIVFLFIIYSRQFEMQMVNIFEVRLKKTISTVPNKWFNFSP